MSRGIHHLFVDNFLNANENHLHYHSYLTWTTGIDLIADANDYHSHYHSYLAGENHSHLVGVPRGTTGCGRVWGEVRIIRIAILIAISTFGTAGIYTLSAPRIYYAMAKDGLFFKKLAEVHPRFRTPVNAILLQSTWAIVLLLFWGTFEDVITYVVFTDWIFFGLTAAGIFVFRNKRSEIVRPYKTHGYPLTPIIFISITVFFIVNTLIEKPLHAWAGLVFMVIGTFLFFYFKRRRK